MYVYVVWLAMLGLVLYEIFKVFLLQIFLRMWF